MEIKISSVSSVSSTGAIRVGFTSHEGGGVATWMGSQPAVGSSHFVELEVVGLRVGATAEKSDLIRADESQVVVVGVVEQVGPDDDELTVRFARGIVVVVTPEARLFAIGQRVAIKGTALELYPYNL
jgi:hypothetical protein